MPYYDKPILSPTPFLGYIVFSRKGDWLERLPQVTNYISVELFKKIKT